MRVVYNLPVKDGVVISISDQEKKIAFDNINVKWEMNKENHLAFVNLIITGIELTITNRGFIQDSFPELEERAFQVGSYVANRIFIQTGVEALDPNFVFYGYVNVFPETLEEEKIFANHRTAFHSCLPITWNIIKEAFQPPEDFTNGFMVSKAFANYADGLRVPSPFLRYEQFYKVLEHVCDSRDENLFCNRISSLIFQYDQGFTPDSIRCLRYLRNRIIHPKTPYGHLNPSDVVSTREVESSLPLLQSIVKKLLQHFLEANDEEI